MGEPMAAARVRPTRQRRGRRGRHRLEPRRAPRTLGSSIDPISWSPMVGRSPGHRQSAGEARNALHFQIWNCNCINRLAGRSLRRNAGRCRTVQDWFTQNSRTNSLLIFPVLVRAQTTEFDRSGRAACRVHL